MLLIVLWIQPQSYYRHHFSIPSCMALLSTRKQEGRSLLEAPSKYWVGVFFLFLFAPNFLFLPWCCPTSAISTNRLYMFYVAKITTVKWHTRSCLPPAALLFDLLLRFRNCFAPWSNSCGAWWLLAKELLLQSNYNLSHRTKQGLFLITISAYISSNTTQPCLVSLLPSLLASRRNAHTTLSAPS